MIITCPDCSTQYEIEDRLIPPSGRNVRCVSCSATWFMAGTEAVSSGQPKVVAAQPSNVAEARSVLATLSRIKDDNEGEFDPVFNDDEAFWDVIRDQTQSLTAPKPQNKTGKFGQAAPRVSRINQLQKALEIEGVLDKQKLAKSDDPAIELEESAPDVFTPAPEPSAPALIEVPDAAKKEGSDPETLTQEPDVKSAARQAMSGLGAFATASLGLASRTLGEASEAYFSWIARLSSGKKTETEQPEGNKAAEAFRRKIRWQKKNQLTPFRFLGWSIWAGCLVGLSYAMIFMRMDVMQIWPQTERFYQVVGLAPPAGHLVLDKVSHRYALSDKGPVIELRGLLTNEDTKAAPAPRIQVAALNENGTVLENWVIDVPVAQLQPQMETPFISRAPAPEGVASLRLTPLLPDDDHMSGKTDEYFMRSISGGWSQETPKKGDEG